MMRIGAVKVRNQQIWGVITPANFFLPVFWKGPDDGGGREGAEDEFLICGRMVKSLGIRTVKNFINVLSWELWWWS